MKLVFEKGKPPFDVPYIPLGRETSLEWVSYANKTKPNSRENLIEIITRSDPDPDPNKGYRKVDTLASIKLKTKREPSNDIEVHRKFFELYLAKPEIQKSIVKQVLSSG